MRAPFTIVENKNIHTQNYGPEKYPKFEIVYNRYIQSVPRIILILNVPHTPYFNYEKLHNGLSFLDIIALWFTHFVLQPIREFQQQQKKARVTIN